MSSPDDVVEGKFWEKEMYMIDASSSSIIFFDVKKADEVSLFNEENDLSFLGR